MDSLTKFTEKYQLAKSEAIKTLPEGGLCGLEIEWNLLDSKFRPLLTVGSETGRQSFVDYLRSECLSPRMAAYSQLEVFHWMIEWATRPYYYPQAAIFEARMMEAVLINALDKSGREFKERLYMWHGNLPVSTPVSAGSIPGSWHLAKRRYLEKCVELYGQSLATTGTHSNLSLPDPLFEWDYLRLPVADRTGGSVPPLHLDEFKSQFFITATRLMRAFAALFIATSASTPFRAGESKDEPVVYLTPHDSVRNLTFPNPVDIDLPDLYRSLPDYLHLSYDLVRRGIRFGNNNWTPVRARSFAEPVERLIEMTSDQLQDYYARGLYVLGEDRTSEDIVKQIEIQNMLARINLPLARVEIRTDDGGNSVEIDTANLTLKHLLLLRIYADSDFARAFRYDREDINRARRNEDLAARNGLRAEIENPFTGKPVDIRSFLAWTIDEIGTLAEVLELDQHLNPLKEMVKGKPNTAETLRARIISEMGLQKSNLLQEIEVPLDLIRMLAEEREEQIKQDIEMIIVNFMSIPEDRGKLSEFIQFSREDARLDVRSPIRFKPPTASLVDLPFPDKMSEIIALARQLIEIPSVTASPNERLDEVRRVSTFVYDYLSNHGVGVRYYDQDKYPAIFAGFPGQMTAPIMFSGHLDVVEPEPDNTQFISRVEGDYLWGRGSADMKTVVATYLVWIKDQVLVSRDFPPVSLLLVSNEENGEYEAMGTPHVLRLLDMENYTPGILIAGERTGEKGSELWGEVCTENRGIMRLEVLVKGSRGHTGTGQKQKDLVLQLLDAQASISEIVNSHLTLTSPEGWCSQVNYSYIEAGTPGIFNISADTGRVGIEVRSIPSDDLQILLKDLEAVSKNAGYEVKVIFMDNGVTCDPENPYLKVLIRSISNVSGTPPTIGKKLPGTSARFAPGGQGVVWGQSGLAPHAADERHYIPSIMPYYNALNEFANLLLAM
jgi:succinyl-diaminopimelate desuccinylase